MPAYTSKWKENGTLNTQLTAPSALGKQTRNVSSTYLESQLYREMHKQARFHL